MNWHLDDSIIDFKECQQTFVYFNLISVKFQKGHKCLIGLLREQGQRLKMKIEWSFQMNEKPRHSLKWAPTTYTWATILDPGHRIKPQARCEPRFLCGTCLLLCLLSKPPGPAESIFPLSFTHPIRFMHPDKLPDTPPFHPQPWPLCHQQQKVICR